MATLALAVHTTTPKQPKLASGFAYIVFPDPIITVQFLIAEKVRAELRKARANQSSSLPLLINTDGDEIGHDPLSEVLATEQATYAFVRGKYLILVDGRPMTRLDETIALTRRTGIQFLVPDAEPTDEHRWAEAGIEIQHLPEPVMGFTDPWSVISDGVSVAVAPSEGAARRLASKMFWDLTAAEAIGAAV